MILLRQEVISFSVPRIRSLHCFCTTDDRYSSHVFDLSYAHPHLYFPLCMLPAAEVFPVKRTIKEKSNTAWSRSLNFAHGIASGDNSRQQRGHSKKMSQKIIIFLWMKQHINRMKNLEEIRGTRRSTVKILRKNRKNPKLIVMRSHQLWKKMFLWIIKHGFLSFFLKKTIGITFSLFTETIVLLFTFASYSSILSCSPVP